MGQIQLYCTDAGRGYTAMATTSLAELPARRDQLLAVLDALRIV